MDHSQPKITPAGRCKGLVKKSGQGHPCHLLYSLIAIHSEIQKIPRTLVNFSQTGKGHLWYQQVSHWDGMAGNLTQLPLIVLYPMTCAAFAC